MSQPTISPYLLYENVEAALLFLERAFGFSEVTEQRYTDETGVIRHAEMLLDSGRIMLGFPGAGYEAVGKHKKLSVMMHVYVADVNAHFERALASGATVLSEPSDQPYGDRRYDVEDLEGHRWSFATRVRDVSPDDWKASMRGTTEDE